MSWHFFFTDSETSGLTHMLCFESEHCSFRWCWWVFWSTRLSQNAFCSPCRLLVVNSNMIIEKMEMMKMMDMNDAHRLRPPNPPLDVLSHFVASRRTVEQGRLQPKQTYCLYLDFLYYFVLTACRQSGPCIRVQPKQTYWQHTWYLSFFFTRAKFLENKIYTEKREFFALNL